MRRSCRILPAFLPCLALSACTTTLYGYQSSSGGATTTVTSASVFASTSSSSARVSFVSGPRVPANVPGGQLTVSSSSAGALGVTVLVGVLASYIVGKEGPKPLPAGTKLLHTCSCYGYQPRVNGE
ncbi:MAG: hypothetical protein OEP48_07210 [Betaproteobacteria bacterium]|nr:hypothetical protein [Betaproteobacteria bacterium]